MRRILLVGLAVVAVGAQSATAIENAQAAGSIKASVSLTAPSSGVYGSAIKLTGRLWRTGTSSGLANATVWLQRSAHAKGAYGNLRSAKTSSSGNFSFSVTQTGAYDYRVTYGGSATYTKATSPTRYPVTNRKMLFDEIKTISWGTGLLRVTGRAVPAPPNGTTVTLQVYSGGKWVNLASGKTSSGNVTIDATRPASTAWYRIVTGARYPYGAGASATKVFTHYRWRGAFTKPPVMVDANGRTVVTVAPVSEDPGRSKVRVAIESSGFVSIRPDMAGCKSFRSWTGNVDPATTRSTVISLWADGQLRTNGTRGGGAGELALSMNLAGVSYMEYITEPSGSAGTDSYGRMQLLCAN